MKPFSFADYKPRLAPKNALAGLLDPTDDAAALASAQRMLAQYGLPRQLTDSERQAAVHIHINGLPSINHQPDDFAKWLEAGDTGRARMAY